MSSNISPGKNPESSDALNNILFNKGSGQLTNKLSMGIISHFQMVKDKTLIDMIDAEKQKLEITEGMNYVSSS